MSKNLKLKKVNKSLVFFGFLYAYEHYERFMHVNILVIFLDVDMLHCSGLVGFIASHPHIFFLVILCQIQFKILNTSYLVLMSIFFKEPMY